MAAKSFNLLSQSLTKSFKCDKFTCDEFLNNKTMSFVGLIVLKVSKKDLKSYEIIDCVDVSIFKS